MPRVLCKPLGGHPWPASNSPSRRASRPRAVADTSRGIFASAAVLSCPATRAEWCTAVWTGGLKGHGPPNLWAGGVKNRLVALKALNYFPHCYRICYRRRHKTGRPVLLALPIRTAPTCSSARRAARLSPFLRRGFRQHVHSMISEVEPTPITRNARRASRCIRPRSLAGAGGLRDKLGCPNHFEAGDAGW
jgi:hypothetical protein